MKYQTREENGKTILYGVSPDLKSPDVEYAYIPEGIDEIAPRAFSNCEELGYVEIPDNVKIIGDKAFEGCKNLNDVEIPDNVKIIGDKAFAGCKKLNNVKIADGIKTIGDKAFAGCERLEEITIPSSVETIGDYVFENCEELREVYFDSDSTVIGRDAFEGCWELREVDCKGYNIKDINLEGSAHSCREYIEEGIRLDQKEGKLEYLVVVTGDDHYWDEYYYPLSKDITEKDLETIMNLYEKKFNATRAYTIERSHNNPATEKPAEHIQGELTHDDVIDEAQREIDNMTTYIKELQTYINEAYSQEVEEVGEENPTLDEEER